MPTGRRHDAHDVDIMTQVFVHLSGWVSHTRSNDLHLSDARSSTNYWTFSSVVNKPARSTPLECWASGRDTPYIMS